MSHAFFRIDSEKSTLVLLSTSKTMLRVLYWGEALAADADLQSLADSLEQPLPNGALDVAEVVSWLPEPGRGFTDFPGLQLRRGERFLYTQFELANATKTASGWQFELEEPVAGLALTLEIAVHHATGVLSAHCILTNRDSEALTVDALASFVMPVPMDFTERTSIGGRWTAEFRATREHFGSGAWLQESRVGRTSHHAFPGVMLFQPGVNASKGEIWSAQLAWSGNHRMLTQRTRLGGQQLHVGELLLPGEISLATNESYQTPTLHLARGKDGTRELSARWHQFVRSTIVPVASRERERKVHFNTWEATYFDHDSKTLEALACAAADVGVERFVLDDGWFVGRHDDRAALGDWTPCPTRYPNGLAPLANRCRELGMQFGLWVEPESVSENSDLFRAHSDWIIYTPGLKQPLGRHQYVLNFARPEVRAHLFNALSTLLRSADISFLKWDMNRDMTHAANPRAHVLGLYSLLDQLRAAFPNVEIESCASGGGRTDLGVLRRTERVWVSDCNDPIERQLSQRTYLDFFPPETMGVHVGDARSHTTERTSSIELRTLNALFGHLGIEANLLTMPEADRTHLRSAIAFHKTVLSWVHRGIVTPIDSADRSHSALLAVAKDQSTALLSLIALERSNTALTAPQKIPGLAHDAIYAVRIHPLWPANPSLAKHVSTFQYGRTIELTGQLLEHGGVALPIMTPGSGILIELMRKPVTA
jgi:alpha-galactosidase